MKDIKKVILFGRSDFLKEISKENIKILQENYFNIGMNSFPIIYPNVNLWSFTDEDTLDDIIQFNYKGQKILCDRYYESALNCYEMEGEFYDSFEDSKPSYNKDFVSIHHLTITAVINWCILKGFTEVYLIGHDLNNTKWDYFDSLFSKPAPKSIIDKVRDYIYQCAKAIKIYQVNPNNDMLLDKVSVSELLEAIVLKKK